MKVLSADFVTSAALRPAVPGIGEGRRGGPVRRTPDGVGALHGVPRDGLPQIALAGRSNVGKSTLINALCRRQVARTSAAPGKTRLANVYRITLEGAGPGTFALYFVDLPGFGYARGGEDAASELKAVAEAYFSEGQHGPGRGGATGLQLRAAPRATLLLIDSRHPGLQSDLSAHAWLAAIGGEPHVVATKIDKLSRSERARNLKAIGDIFGTAALPVSAHSGEGLNDLWQLIIRLAKNP